MAILGMHAILYSAHAEATRAVLRDVLGWTSVDAGGGWLIFAAPPAEVAVHPTDGPPHHELFLMCTNLDGTIAELAGKGVAAGPIEVQGWGRATTIEVAPGETIGLYEPRHPVAIPL